MLGETTPVWPSWLVLILPFTLATSLVRIPARFARLACLWLTQNLQFFAKAAYNLWFHPLRNVPGPFWARVSAIPSWYHALTGKRHIWLWQQFQIYGDKIRPQPDTVLFRNPEAYTDIYSLKANVRRGSFYLGLRRQANEGNTLTTTDVAEHALKRKHLSLAFNEKSLRSATTFMVQHIDRWHEILLAEHDSSADWSTPMDFSKRVDALAFDVIGDLAFGRSFDIKEPGVSPMKAVPELVAGYMKFYYPVSQVKPYREVIGETLAHVLEALQVALPGFSAVAEATWT